MAETFTTNRTTHTVDNVEFTHTQLLSKKFKSLGFSLPRIWKLGLPPKTMQKLSHHHFLLSLLYLFLELNNIT